jgi:glycosyltransferase involved in cell wall biosynthesis
MITTNRLQDIPKKAYRVIYQKMLKFFPSLLYKFILKNKKYDIEFAGIHGLRDEILNSPNKNSKKIIWIHNDLRKTHFHNYTDEEIRKFLGYDKILVISEHIQKDFENLAQNEIEKSKIIRIYNPLDTEEIKSKAEVKTEIEAEFKIKAEIQEHQPSTINHQPLTINQQPTFVSIGTVFPQKGYDRLLKVHRKLLNEGFNHNILIIGDGYDFENIKKLQNELKVENSATLLGFTDNPYPYLKNADYFVLSSRYEGFPTVLFEAITLKKNIIATDVSGVSEMLENGKLGLIIENSEDGIYAGMKQALTQPESFEKYQKELQEYKIPFDLENSVQEIMKVIDGI